MAHFESSYNLSLFMSKLPFANVENQNTNYSARSMVKIEIRIKSET